jgi:putative methionine-R-sulfoxide reductase with GAF domain
VSVATVEESALLYVAAAGAGADAIVGTRLAAGRGIAGFAAATGQSVTVRDPASDPRFARDVGDATGYTPAAIQCVPVDADGEVIAVLSILDRAESDALAAGTPVAVEQITALVAVLLSGPAGGPGASIEERLGRLPDATRGRAVAAVDALLTALEP